jgi:signal transduction histidine kinase
MRGLTTSISRAIRARRDTRVALPLLWSRTERILFRHILKTRVPVFALAGLLLLFEAHVPHRRVGLATSEWAILMLWSIGTAWRADDIYSLLKHRPAWLLVEESGAVALLIVGGWRNFVYLFALSTIVTTALFFGYRTGLYLATINAVALFGFLGLARLFDFHAGYERSAFIRLSLAVAVFYLAVFFCREVRLRYLELAGRFERQVLVATRHEIADVLHNRLKQVFPAIRYRLIGLREDYASDAHLLEEIDWIDERLDEGLAHLARLLREVTGSEGTRSITQIARIAVARVESIGDLSIDLTLDRCGVAELDRQRARALQRFLEEALTNAWKHGKPPLLLEGHLESDNTVEIEVIDQGGQFRGRRVEGYGLRSLLRDARLLEGRVTIASDGRNGTRVALTFPKETMVT